MVMRAPATSAMTRATSDMEAAERHCTQGLGVWSWASTDRNQEPDAVLACAGDVPTLEALAAANGGSSQ